MGIIGVLLWGNMPSDLFLFFGFFYLCYVVYIADMLVAHDRMERERREAND